MKYGILIVVSQRSKEYLKIMKENGFIPSCAILLNGEGTLEEKLLKIMNVDITYLTTEQINDDIVYSTLKEKTEEIFIFTGGGIVGNRLLSLKKFIHIHPGLVPKYRGSTCFYYSILREGTIGMSAIYLSEKLDQGDVLAKKIFPVPKTTDIDSYIPKLRAQMLIFVLQNKLFKGYPQESEGNIYYIIHPVLKHLAILKANSNTIKIKT